MPRRSTRHLPQPARIDYDRASTGARTVSKRRMPVPLTSGTRRKTVAAKAVSGSAIETITTAIHIPKETWTLLRAVAFKRAQETGGRASVSKLVAELVEAYRPKFEAELNPH
jgi:hypothetical protein